MKNRVLFSAFVLLLAVCMAALALTGCNKSAQSGADASPSPAEETPNPDKTPLPEGIRIIRCRLDPGTAFIGDYVSPEGECEILDKLYDDMGAEENADALFEIMLFEHHDSDYHSFASEDEARAYAEALAKECAAKGINLNWYAGESESEHAKTWNVFHYGYLTPRQIHELAEMCCEKESDYEYSIEYLGSYILSDDITWNELDVWNEQGE